MLQGKQVNDVEARAAEVRASGLPLDAVLDDLIREEGSHPIYVIQVVMDAYSLSLPEAKGVVETRCHELG